MKVWLVFLLCIIQFNAYAKENLDSTILDGTLAFPTAVIPDKAAVVVSCTFEMQAIQTQDFYAYVMPYSGTFSDIQTAQAFHGDVSIGSKVYMPTTSKTFKISIIGVTNTNDAILVDLTRMPPATNVKCEF